MYEEKFRQIYEAICDGLKCESEKRLQLYKDADTGNEYSFSLSEERELGTQVVLAHHLSRRGYFTRLDWYFRCADNRLRPDLTIWIPKENRLLFLELKRVAQGWSYGHIHDDLKKLNAVSKLHKDNKLNGLIAIGFSRMEDKVKPYLDAQIRNIKKDCPYYLFDQRELKLADMDGYSNYVTVALIIREHGK